MNETCENCLFFRSTLKEVGFGTCQRFPPHPVATEFTKWAAKDGSHCEPPSPAGMRADCIEYIFPEVHRSNWCGEWKA